MILTAAQLTPSGRPVLQQGEVEVSLLDKVDLEFQPVGGLPGQPAEAYKNGYAILTTRRLIWVEERSPAGGDGTAAAAAAASIGSGGGGGSTAAGAVRAASLPLAAVVACQKRVQYSLKGPKVCLVLELYTDRQRQPVAASGFHTHIDLLALRCRGPAPDTFKAQLDEQVRQAVAADAAADGQTSRASVAGGGTGASAASASAASASAAQGPYPDVHWSPLKAGLQARASPRLQSEGSAAAAALGLVGAQGATSPGVVRGQSAGAAAAARPAVQSPAAESRPDPVLLQAMVEMGFPRNRAARSLLATRNQGAQEAIDYLLAFGDQPGMDDPLDTPPPPGAAAGALAGRPPPPPAAFDGGSRRYPAILPSSGPPTGGSNSPYTVPYNSHSPAAAVLYGGTAAGPASPAGFGAQPLLSKQLTSLRQYPHQYGSAPDLAGTAGSALSSPVAGQGSSVTAGGAPAAHAIGVAGIVKREHQKTAETGRAVEQAFRDLSALMSSAAAMVALAERFRGVMGAEGGSAGGSAGSGGGGGEDPLLLDLETQQQLISLGISSPVTRGTAGARYHIELSRQLADFLAAPLQRVGGLMSLPDVYCLFNRARGTELVSPDDLLQAAKLFSRSGVHSLRLHPLSSGVLVIQGPQHSEEQVCAKIAQMTTPPPPPLPAAQDNASASAAPTPPPPLLGPALSASDLALALGGISVAIAAEHLLTAEAHGVVCRDDGPEGLRFFRNFFAQDRLEPTALKAGG